MRLELFLDFLEEKNSLHGNNSQAKLQLLRERLFPVLV